MKCRDFDRMIDAFLRGELLPELVRQMELHRDSCASCRDQFRQWQAISAGARDLPRVAAPAGFEAELMRRIRAQEHRRWRYLVFDLPRPAVQALACAALVLVVGLSAFLVRSYYSPGESPGTEYQTAGNPASSRPIMVPSGDLPVAPGLLEVSSLGDADSMPVPAIPIRAGFRSYAIPQNAEYVDYLLKGTGDREVYVRLPRTIIYHPPADNDLYYVRNISH